MSPPRESHGMRSACDECHIRKLRCSRNTTSCTRCVRNNIKCFYSPARKAGRRSKAERLASSDAATYKNGNVQRMSSFKSLGADDQVPSSPPLLEEDAAHATFWADLAGDGFGPLPWQGLWSSPFSADEAGLGHGEGRARHDGISMAMNPNDLVNVDFWDGQSLHAHPTNSHISTRLAPNQTQEGGSERIESATFFTSTQNSDANKSTSSEPIYGNIQRLSKLQQDLFVHRTCMSDMAGESCRGEVMDIDAVIGVGQAILELTRSLFACFTTSEPLAGKGRGDGGDDPARILLALTPSLLVVTTYNDILDLISRAVHELKQTPASRDMVMSESTFFAPTTSHDSSSSSPRAPREQPRHYHHGGLYGKTLHVGKVNLDFPVRLILSMTIMEYQLGPLYRSLQLIRSKPLPRPGNECLDSSRDMLAPSTEGLWSATQGLRERLGKLIEQTKQLDKH